jgi:hypothetical protein
MHPSSNARRGAEIFFVLYAFVAVAVSVRFLADSWLVAGGSAAVSTIREAYSIVSSLGSMSPSPTPSSSPSPFLPGLVIMSDNRPLVSDLSTANYVSLAAAVNFLYARRYNYDFEYFLVTFNMTKARALGVDAAALELGGKAVKRDFFAQDILSEAYNPRDRATCYHPGFKALRAASWSKLVPSWLASQRRYTWVMYLDSDCIIQDHNLSINDYTYGKAVGLKSWGVPPKDANILFMSNLPWLPDYPIAGFYWFHPGPYMTRFFQYWWDVEDPGHAFKHGFEQESLWNWMAEYRDRISIINWHSLSDSPNQWVRHYGSNNPDFRVPGIMRTVKQLGIDAERFSAIIAEINANYTTIVDVIDVALEMERARPVDSRLPSYVFPDNGTGTDTCVLRVCSPL